MSGLAVEKISEISTRPDLQGVKTGKIIKIDQNGVVFIDFSGNRQGPIQARVTAAAIESIRGWSDSNDITVLIAFEENDTHRPVIIDVICDQIDRTQSSIPIDRGEIDDVRIDSETLTFDAKKEIVLRCGKSSITLTSAGKVLIRGAYLLNRSSGVNRIRGASVHVN